MARYIQSTKHACTYLLKHEAANYLRVSPSAFRRLEKQGCLPPPIMLGSLVRYRIGDLDKHIAPDSMSNDNGDSASILDAVQWD